MRKTSSVISPVQKTLAPDVFDKDGFLHPEIQAAIEERIVKVVPSEQIKNLYILGSITGYKWEDASDIDVSVYVFPFDATKEKTKATKEINGFPVPPYKRPLSFFLMEWRPTTESSILKTDFGVYDVRARAWINPPGDPSLVRSPDDEFWVELQTARLLRSEFERKAKEYYKDKAELDLLKSTPREPGDLFAYTNIQKKLREVESGYQGLLKFVEELDKDRKFAYSWG